MATTTSYPGIEGGADRYYEIKGELWEYFYSLKFDKRVSIILSELKYIILFLAGWIAFTAFLRYGHFTMAALPSLSALAQDASPHAGPAAAITEQQSKVSSMAGHQFGSCVGHARMRRAHAIR